MGRRLAWLVVALLAGCKDEKPKTSEERTADALARVDQIS